METETKPTQTPKVETLEGGELNVKNSKRKIWLVKVPTFLADAW